MCPHPLRRRAPRLAALLAFALLGAADLPTVRPARAEAPLPSVQPPSRESADPTLRRAPKSLAYLYGEEPADQDPEASGGGDGGTNSGGEGTGDANKPGDPPQFGTVQSADLSDDSPLAFASEFNALALFDPDLGAELGRRVGNRALCFCADSTQVGWVSAPGYGNDWDMRAVWTGTVSDPASVSTARVRFVVNHDLEPGADVFRLEVGRDAATRWEVVRELTGTNVSVVGGAPVVVDETIVLLPSDYAGTGGDEVRLRLRVLTDRIGSDEDGLWPSNGAAQVDDVRVWLDGGLAAQADFEITGSDGGWTPVAPEAAGDFLKLLQLTTDLDPCRQNVTYQFSFVDDGTPPVNDPSGIGTGGATSPTWTYGPAGAVVNYGGGISQGQTALHGALRTDPFAWDLAGTDDDGLWGGQLEFSLFEHLPLENGIFYFWEVRSRDATGWTSWRDFGEVYYAGAPRYERVVVDVSPLLVAEPESVQVQLGVIDLADALGLPGGDATPSPMFDNIAFAKFQIAGAVIDVRDGDRFQDAFPPSGSSDFAGPAANLALRLDAARDVVPGPVNVPGDSMVVRVRSLLPGSALSGPPVLEVLLRANPRFDADRVLPTGFVAVGSVPGLCGGPARTLYAGEVIGQPVTTSTGQPVADHWFFDLPDGPARPNAGWQTAEPAFFFPGDELRWYVRAQDTLGNTSTFPEDLAGFELFDARATYPHRVVGLPSLGGASIADPVTQPSVLVIDDSGSFDEGALVESSLAQIGYGRGCEVDVYRVQAAGSGLGNGIGSGGAHGANAAQLAGYSTVLVFSGEQSSHLLSDGSGTPLHDDGDDLAVLDAWRQLVSGARAAYFGDDFVSGLLRGGAAGSDYVTSVLGVELVADDVRDLLGGEIAPRVDPVSTAFLTSFVVGGCFAGNQFDAIAPRPGATSTHVFVDPSAPPGSGPHAAGIVNVAGTASPSTHVTFPFAFSAILEPLARDASGLSARARLLAELLGFFGETGGIATGTPPSLPRHAVLEPNAPNPFNPRTTIAFVLPRPERVELSVYDVSGRAVRQLLAEPRAAGRHTVVWDGRDDRGRDVASGVYLVRLRAGDDDARRKVALVR